MSLINAYYPIATVFLLKELVRSPLLATYKYTILYYEPTVFMLFITSPGLSDFITLCLYPLITFTPFAYLLPPI